MSERMNIHEGGGSKQKYIKLEPFSLSFERKDIHINL
jgi:hypothetical protein